MSFNISGEISVIQFTRSSPWLNAPLNLRFYFIVWEFLWNVFKIGGSSLPCNIKLHKFVAKTASNPPKEIYVHIRLRRWRWHYSLEGDQFRENKFHFWICFYLFISLSVNQWAGRKSLVVIRYEISLITVCNFWSLSVVLLHCNAHKRDLKVHQSRNHWSWLLNSFGYSA